VELTMNCKSLCGMDLNRPHWSCFIPIGSCWIRRWFYKKEKGLRKVDDVVRVENNRGEVLRLENKRGIMVLPERCEAKIIFVNQDCKHPRIRNLLLKIFLTMAEALGRW